MKQRYLMPWAKACRRAEAVDQVIAAIRAFEAGDMIECVDRDAGY